MGTPHEPGASWAQLQRRIHAEWLSLNAVLLLLTFLLSFYGGSTFLPRLNYLVYDATMSATARHRAHEDIVIIAIDDGSIEELGYWPWPRANHARLIDRLGQAKAVGLDILFNDKNPAYPDDDRRLAQAIERQGRVVLPLVADAKREILEAPLPILARAAHALGRIDAHTDQDGAIRSVILQSAHPSGERLAHFSIAMAQAGGAGAAAAPLMQAPDNTPFFISYAGPPKSFTLYPYAKVLNGEVPESAFHDKYVLIGSWASGLGDVLPTPFSRHDTSMAGVEVLANTLQNVLENGWIHMPGRWSSALLATLPVLLAGLSLRRLSPRRSIALSAAVLLAIVAFNGALMYFARAWVPPAASMLGVMLIYPLWSWRSQEASLRHIDDELRLLHNDRLLSTAAPQGWTHIDDSLPARLITLHQSIALLRTAVRQREEALRFLSHDMRSPQNSILALAQLQRRTPSSLPEEELLEKVEHYAQETLHLVDGFVHLARAEIVEMNRHEQDLIEIISGACDARWPQAAERSITIRFTPHAEHAYAWVDSNLLGRAIGNLLDNAVNYSFHGSTIDCEVSLREGLWLITVRDQGPGIPPEQLQALFKPFNRLQQDAADSPPGSGLGLAFVQIVMRRHGGDIECRSILGQGSVFIARLPA